MFCENCGAQVNPGAKICPRCGKPPREERGLFKTLFLLAVAAVMIGALVLIYAGYFYLGQAYQERKQPEPSAVSSPKPAARQGGTSSGDKGGPYDLTRGEGGYFRIK